MTDGDPGGLSGRFLPEDPDTVDALRLADVLERVESGHAPDLDPTEDPALSHLLTTAMRVRAELGAINDAHAFHSFHTRSRAAILHSLERRARPANVTLFARRARILAPFAAVAAAAAIAISAFGPTLSPDRGAPETAATNLTPRTTSEELDRLATALANIQEHAQSGQPVPAPLLRAVSEGAARVANIIEQSPERLSKETVTTYQQAAQAGQAVLSAVTVDQDAQGALAAAQRAARDGIVVAGRFLNNTTPAPATPPAAASATPAATASPSPTPAATATPTVTPATPAAPRAPSTAPGAETAQPPSDIVR